VKLSVLALDYDGTIATDGRLHPDVRAAITEVRAQGLVVVLVTGRLLSDLRVLVGDLRLFDAIVAENGAVTAFPEAGRSAHHAPRCPRPLVEALAEHGVEVRAGECIVELDASAAHAVLDVIRERELPFTLHFNRGRLMVLPPAISKATGLREALRALRLSMHNAIGLGDAENDHELLSACEIGFAVGWGSPVLQEAADEVLEGDGPGTVATWLRTISRGPRILTPPIARRHLVLGRDADGKRLSLSVRGRNVLIAGDPRSGKSWVAGLLGEQLVLQGYCLCLIDPEGDYESLESLPGVVMLGGNDPAPSMNELARTLRHADVSVIVGLARMKNPDKHDYVVRALRMLTELRRETGLPHRIVVDEAHYFLDDPDVARTLDPELAGYTLITYRVSGLHPDVLAASECVIVTRETDAAEARLLHDLRHGREDLAHWEETLQSLEIDEACLLPGSEESGESLKRFRVAPRLTYHVRHRHKYLDVPVADDVAFRFRFEDGRTGPVVGSLHRLVEVLEHTPTERIRGHLARGDLSRWLEQVFRDPELADEIRALEDRHRLGHLADFNGAATHAVRERYEVEHGFL